MKLLPKDEKFFELFCQHSGILCKASSLLVEALRSGYDGVCQAAPQMEKLERQGDEIIHEIFRRLRSTFLTPIDPEDIQALATSLDDVLDYLEDATFRIVAYRLDPIPPPTVELGQMLAHCCQSLSHALVALQERKSVVEDCIEVNRLENQADQLERTLVAELFRSEKDPLTLIKQKEVYEVLEGATDRCEDVADVLQSVAVKNS
jgi:uncharacterized protein